ncbi:beta-N-acetylhexosaminidase [Candidatus Saccharibacteria bacterium]|nr:beta-N-acetylhexosaminidase [Candidatus Saccharibacteria bacterium]
MKFRVFLLLVLFLISAGATAFVVAPLLSQRQNNTNQQKEQAMEKEQYKPEPTPAPAPEPEVDPITEEIKKMTLDEKIAQLLIVQNPGMQISEAEIKRLKTAPYGGYILMENNYGTLSATRKFVKDLQSYSKRPLIISTDQEGGNVQRIQMIQDRPATNIPEMYRVGKTNDTELAKEIGRIMAEEMRVIGINVDFAPDADVFLNPNNTVIGRRSFSEKPEIVAKMSLALAHGLEENGVIATYKHFPGHGDTAVDSHLSLPIINRTREQLDEEDLIPFKNAIENGAKIIMTGHIALPKITNNNTPATLSKKINKTILRNELGFDGLIVTDGMNMGALANNYPEAEVYYRAINAGIDLLLLPSHPELAIESIKKNVSEERIDESVYRILKFKNNYLTNYEYLNNSFFGSDEHQKVVKRVP